ncbi:MAG: tetratricopeptide repeat protein, partial [Acidimicrobiales bacterium]
SYGARGAQADREDRGGRPAAPRRPGRPYERDERRDDHASSRRPVGRNGPRTGESRGRPSSRGPRAPRELTPEELERQRANTYGQKKGWGGVARRGAVSIRSEGPAMEATPSAGFTPDPLSQWVQEVRPVRATTPATSKPKVKYALPGDVAADVRKAFIGTAYMREKMVATLTRAAEAYDRKRYEEALRLGRTVADATPGVAPVRELTGLAAYRAERWSMAKIHLKAHFTITGDPEHLPLVMDCDRANRRYRAVEKDFAQLEESEPTAEVLAEGRIVMASALADQQLYQEAIELLTRAGATKQLRNPAFRHVRLWYALGDVYDRSGDVISARELFARVVIAEPEAYDASARLAELGASAPRKNRKRRTTPVSKKKVD